ncbi:DUF2846 domain-containing protein [Pseudomonas citronellolis]|uniref:DUF2846 domain-containing protein n=1 Tax=Pseudomonas citronellolis TaxID=53408 RepID=UPI002D7903C9|nr:DUF2846 domain-containing protein [Pseudomonas citronellolis]WRT82514.1 DUF2846 domain-containing protein [Pseudomonas citronellolis]
MHYKRTNTALAVFMGMLLVPFACARQETPSEFQVFGEHYRPVPSAAPDQAQIVYYRSAAQTQKPAGANVYINGHFHTSLLPGGFTAFCLAPGNHLMGAYLHDAPLYLGKREELYRVQLEAGKTYFVKVSDDGSGTPVSVERAEAEAGLQSTRQQIHAISRASTEQCKSVAPAQAKAS